MRHRLGRSAFVVGAATTPMDSLPVSELGQRWFETIVVALAEWVRAALTRGYDRLSIELFETPTPPGTGVEAILGVPPARASPWPAVHESLVGGEMTLLGLLVLFVAVQAHHFLRIFRMGAGGARAVRLSAWTGAALIVGWYWVAVALLSLVDALTVALLADPAALATALVGQLPTAVVNPLVTLLVTGAGGLAMLLVEAIFLVRELLLFVYLYAMPLGIALAFGNLAVVSRIARRFVRGFVPLVLLPLPIAVLCRGYELLLVEGGLFETVDPVGRFLLVCSFPLLAVVLAWVTFQYASPAVGRVVGRGVRAGATVGTAATVGVAAGPAAAERTARRGISRGVGKTVIDRVSVDGGRRGGGREEPVGASEAPAYRRTENDPRRGQGDGR